MKHTRQFWIALVLGILIGPVGALLSFALMKFLVGPYDVDGLEVLGSLILYGIGYGYSYAKNQPDVRKGLTIGIGILLGSLVLAILLFILWCFTMVKSGSCIL